MVSLQSGSVIVGATLAGVGPLGSHDSRLARCKRLLGVVTVLRDDTAIKSLIFGEYMMKWMKRVAVGVLILLVVGAAFIYYQMRSNGFFVPDVYESVAPVLPDFSQPAVLVFTKTNGFIHKEAIPVAKDIFTALVEREGWTVYHTDNGAVHSPELLAKFDFVIWNNVSGDVLTLEQRKALKRRLENGGGWLGIHASGGDPSYEWSWYADTLIGAQFVGHTMRPQFQDADLLIADPSLAITDHLPNPWNVKQEEWYAFDQNVRDKGYEILLTLDESSYKPNGESWLGRDTMPGEHPIAWRHRVGKGRALYSGIGHRADTYHNAEYQAFLSKAMHWVRGQ